MSENVKKSQRNIFYPNIPIINLPCFVVETSALNCMLLTIYMIIANKCSIWTANIYTITWQLVLFYFNYKHFESLKNCHPKGFPFVWIFNVFSIIHIYMLRGQSSVGEFGNVFENLSHINYVLNVAKYVIFKT